MELFEQMPKWAGERSVAQHEFARHQVWQQHQVQVMVVALLSYWTLEKCKSTINTQENIMYQNRISILKLSYKVLSNNKQVVDCNHFASTVVNILARRHDKHD